MFRKIMNEVLLIVSFILLSVVVPNTVQAATSYKVINFKLENNVKRGNYTFKFDTFGIYAIEADNYYRICENRNMHTSILTNGTEVYYCKGEYNFANTGEMGIYRVNLKDKEKKDEKIFSLICERRDLDDFVFAGYSSHKIYYLKDIVKHGDLCSYSLKTGKHVTIEKNVGKVMQHKQYIYLVPRFNASKDFYNFRILDTKNDNIKSLCKKLFRHEYSIISDYVYYVEGAKVSADGATIVSVNRCKLDGSKKKSLIRKLRIHYIGKIGKNSIEYYYNGWKTRKY